MRLNIIAHLVKLPEYSEKYLENIDNKLKVVHIKIIEFRTKAIQHLFKKLNFFFYSKMMKAIFIKHADAFSVLGKPYAVWAVE